MRPGNNNEQLHRLLALHRFDSVSVIQHDYDVKNREIVEEQQFPLAFESRHMAQPPDVVRCFAVARRHIQATLRRAEANAVQRRSREPRRLSSSCVCEPRVPNLTEMASHSRFSIF